MNNNNHYSKTDTRYWEAKVAFQTPSSRTYSIHLQHKGRRAWINLYTANKGEAAARARKFYQDIWANGWDEALRRHKGAPGEAKKANVTISEYLDAVQAKSLIHAKTLESYAAALRKIAGDIHGLSSREKRSTWRTSVDEIKLATLTAEMIESWRTDFIKRGSVNALKERSARVSANSLIGRARSLFGAEVISRVRDVVEIPSPAPFAGIKVQKVRVARYRSSFDIVSLLEAARQELATEKPEEFKVLLLAAMAGLRRNEIDKLEWDAFHFEEGVIRIQATEHFRPKSRESENDVMIDAELVALFRGFYAQRKGDFVIEGESKPDPLAPFGHYRCVTVFKALLGWLRGHGVNSSKPLHALRKEFGSWVNEHFGLYAASAQLRHADIKTTSLHYIEAKRRPVIGFDHLLARKERTIIPMGDTARSA
jgi:integrase